jgi:hypothetical protein
LLVFSMRVSGQPHAAHAASIGRDDRKADELTTARAESREALPARSRISIEHPAGRLVTGQSLGRAVPRLRRLFGRVPRGPAAAAGRIGAVRVDAQATPGLFRALGTAWLVSDSRMDGGGRAQPLSSGRDA